MSTREQNSSLGGLPIQIDYTARDYSSIISELVRHIETIMPEWTDRSSSDMGISILEAVAYLGDILSYNLDRVQNESYLLTAQTRQSVSYLLNLIGYTINPSTPSTVEMVITTTLDNVTLPEGFTVKTANDSDQQSFVLNESVTLPSAGRYAVSYQIEQATVLFSDQNIIADDRLIFISGEKHTDTIGISSGLQDQVFVAPNSPVCISSLDPSPLRVFVGAEEWTAKTSFVGSDPESKVFRYRVSSDDLLLIEFGDGVLGKIPQTGQSIIATYRTGGGEETNRVGVGTITDFDSIEGVDSVYNIAQPQGGTDRESLDHAKKYGPLSLRSLDRCVTLEDFETMAVLTPGGGIRTARAVRGLSPIDVDVYVASEGANPVPSGKWYDDLNNGYGTIGAVGRWLNQKKPVPTNLRVLAPTMVQVYLEANIFVYNNILKAVVEEEVDLALQTLFNTTTDEFGQNLPLSAIHQAIENTRGVDYVDVIECHKVPKVRLINGSQTTLDFTDIAIGNFTQDTKEDFFEIIWTSDQTFKVKGKTNGFALDSEGNILEGITNAFNHIYFLDSDTSLYRSQFTLVIAPGPFSPIRNNVWVFSVNEFKGNINCEDYEILASPIQENLRLDPAFVKLNFLGGI